MGNEDSRKKEWTPDERRALEKRGDTIVEESLRLQMIAEYAALQEKLRLRRDIPPEKRKSMEGRLQELHEKTR